jgi:hypothetical protein
MATELPVALLQLASETHSHAGGLNGSAQHF